MAGPDINALFEGAARRAGRQREVERHEQPHRARTRDDAPTHGAVREGEHLVLGEEDGVLRHFLHGRPLHVGDTIELYTNRANGWLRGRYEWSGRRDDRPRVAVNVWNPHGVPDPDGLPPWVGELEALIPAEAVCRLPAAVAGDTSGVGS